MLSKENLTKTQRKYLNLLIKIAIVALAIWFMISKVNNQKNLREFESLINQVDPFSIRLVLIAVFILMFVNWSLEVVKWKYLCRRIEPISNWKAVKSVFCGLTWAIFTPNRIGEYGGRIMLLKPQNRASGAVAMGVGLFGQLVWTSVFGAVSIAWFVTTFLETPASVDFGVWILAIIYSLAFLILYFNVSWVDRLVGKVKFLKKIKPFFAVLEDFSVKELSYVLLLSIIRFIIFTSQYIILMSVIIPGMPVVSMVLMIFIMFFIQSAVPTLDIFDFSVRSFVASNLYAYITTQEIAVMAIVSCVWFVNIIFPAIIGSVFVLNVNYISDTES